MQSLRSALLFLILFAATGAEAASLLPGFRLEKVATASGFVTSLAFDAQGRLHYSVTEGDLYRLDASGETRVAKVPTAAIGNAVFLGAAFRGEKVIAHYVAPDLSADIVAELDLEAGSIRELARLVCSGGRPCSSEHHGGNPFIAPDGTVYVGIGDLGFRHLAEGDGPASRIFRIAPDGTLAVFARGFRNPYDLALAPSGDFLIVGDNGAEAADEIHFTREGDHAGWPSTGGSAPSPPGMTPPVYVFPETVAPTGLTLVRGLVPGGGTGYLVGTFVTRGLYLFPDIDAPRQVPVAIFEDLPQLGMFNSILDVVQSPGGEIVFATPGEIWKLVPPEPGDVNGDGELTEPDLEALAHELVDGDGDGVLEIHGGDFAASWGADVNRDGRVDSGDLVAWVILAQKRGRLVKRP